MSWKKLKICNFNELRLCGSFLSPQHTQESDSHDFFVNFLTPKISEKNIRHLRSKMFCCQKIVKNLLNLPFSCTLKSDILIYHSSVKNTMAGKNSPIYDEYCELIVGECEDCLLEQTSWTVLPARDSVPGCNPTITGRRGGSVICNVYKYF